MEKVDEFQNILREKYRINKTQQNKIMAYNSFIISSLLDILRKKFPLNT